MAPAPPVAAAATSAPPASALVPPVPASEPAEPTPETLQETPLPEQSALPVADSEGADDQRLLADPADYLVASDGSIEVQAVETLGHYADWLQVRTQRLRELNGYSFRQPVVMGSRVKLDFSRVSPEEFVARRIAYHRDLQEAYSARHRVVATVEHELRRHERAQ